MPGNIFVNNSPEAAVEVFGDLGSPFFEFVAFPEFRPKFEGPEPSPLVISARALAELRGIPSPIARIESLILGDEVQFRSGSGLESPFGGLALREVVERRMCELARGFRGVSIIGGSQLSLSDASRGDLDRFYAELFERFLAEDKPISIGTGGGVGPAMRDAPRIYRQLRESSGRTEGRICQVFSNIEQPNGLGDEQYCVRAQIDRLGPRFQALKLLCPSAVIALPGRDGTAEEIATEVTDNIGHSLSRFQFTTAPLCPILLLENAELAPHWDAYFAYRAEMQRTLGSQPNKYCSDDLFYRIRFDDTERAAERVLELVRSGGRSVGR